MRTTQDALAMPTEQQSLDVDLSALADLGTIVLADSSLDEVMQRIVRLARQSVGSRCEVSLTIVRGDHANTAAWTCDERFALDERQYEQGYGPSLDAAHAGETVLIKDMATEIRWPQFTPLAVAEGVLSSLSVCLPIQQHTLAALTYYSQAANAFDRHAISLAHTFANYAAVALANASHVKHADEVAIQMSQAMASRAIIEQAKGMIMQSLRCNSSQAFAVLAKRSQDSNVKLRELAAQMVHGAGVELLGPAIAEDPVLTLVAGNGGYASS